MSTLWDSIHALFEHPVFRIVAAIIGGVAVVIGLANHSLGIIAKFEGKLDAWRRAPKARQKSIRTFAIVINGDANYPREIRNGFVRKTELLLAHSNYAPVFEEVIGCAEEDSETENLLRFQQLLARFPGRNPDYLVTIGTQVSSFAAKHYLNKLPIVFIGVGSPRQAGLIPESAEDRGNIAGVTYGLDTGLRMKFLSQLVDISPGKNRRIAFICNPNFAQDRHIAEKVKAVAEADYSESPVKFVTINVSEPRLTKAQGDSADIFFGYYYLHAHIGSFMESTHKPIIGLNIQDARKGAAASTGNDDYLLGEVAASQVVERHLLGNVALRDIEVIRPPSAFYVINLGASKKYGLTISQKAMRLSHEIIEG